MNFRHGHIQKNSKSTHSQLPVIVNSVVLLASPVCHKIYEKNNIGEKL